MPTKIEDKLQKAKEDPIQFIPKVGDVVECKFSGCISILQDVDICSTYCSVLTSRKPGQIRTWYPSYIFKLAKSC